MSVSDTWYTLTNGELADAVEFSSNFNRVAAGDLEPFSSSGSGFQSTDGSYFLFGWRNVYSDNINLDGTINISNYKSWQLVGETVFGAGDTGTTEILFQNINGDSSKMYMVIGSVITYTDASSIGISIDLFNSTVCRFGYGILRHYLYSTISNISSGYSVTGNTYGGFITHKYFSCGSNSTVDINVIIFALSERERGYHSQYSIVMSDGSLYESGKILGSVADPTTSASTVTSIRIVLNGDYADEGTRFLLYEKEEDV